MLSRHKKPQNSAYYIPRLWLLTDIRNDAMLEKSIAALPTGSGIIFRHYHLGENARRRRFDTIKKLANAQNHVLALSGDTHLAENWHTDGIYGAPDKLESDSNLLKLATVHDHKELAMVSGSNADAVFISPVFATRSHIDAKLLGVDGFCDLAEKAQCPAIALGGMTADNFKLIPDNIAHGWAAIDGLSKVSK